DLNSGSKHEPRQRDHNQPSNQGLQHSGKDFLNRDPRNRDRGQQAIFDFAGPLKLGDERHGYSPNSGEHHADRDNTREQKALVRCGQKAAADHHPAENEDKEQRLQERLQKELNRVAPRYVSVARKHRGKSLPVQSRKLLPVWCRKRFSRLGSEMWTSQSSTPVVEARLATSATSEPPRSA